MINEFLEMLFPWNTNANSRADAKRRLQVVIAHDRASISPEIINMMREEILEVVARYVEIDRSEMEFSLENSQRMTALIASLPIVKIRRLNSKHSEEEENQSSDMVELNLDLNES
jgi:cell division topological specificity factor